MLHKVCSMSYTVGRSLEEATFLHFWRICQSVKPFTSVEAMPKKRGEKIGKRKENLTDFGELLQQLCEYLDVSDADLARLSGLSHAVISRGTRIIAGEPRRDPSRETVTRLYATLEMVAREKSLPMTQELKDIFFNIAPAHHATPEQSASAKRRMGLMYRMLEEAKKRARQESADLSQEDKEIPPTEL